jgi:putative ABC transport system ATP-binding protein
MTGESGSPLLRLDRVTRVYTLGGTPVPALGPISLEVNQGDYLTVTGPSGSGKSTLLNIIGLLDAPTSGVYTLRDRIVSGQPDDELSRLRNRDIGFIFQTFRLLPQYDVLGNVSLPFLYRDVAPDAVAEQCRRAIERVGLAHRVHHRPGELSGGEMQRVAIARALAGTPSLLLADEPTGNLDQRTGAGILSLFDELHAAGTTIVLVTHDPLIASRSPRQVTLADGQIASERGAR